MGMGGAPRASILMGKKDNEGAEKILGNCFSALGCDSGHSDSSRFVVQTTNCC